MYMLFVRFENFTYYHLHSTWELHASAANAAKELLENKNAMNKIVDYRIVPICNS